MTDVPPQAITATADAIQARYGQRGRLIAPAERWAAELAEVALEAAAPHLAAADPEKEQPTYEADPQLVDWDRLNRLRGIGAHEPEDGYEPFTAAGPPETEVRVVPESAVAEAVAAERERCAQHLETRAEDYLKSQAPGRLALLAAARSLREQP